MPRKSSKGARLRVMMHTVGKQRPKRRYFPICVGSKTDTLQCSSQQLSSHIQASSAGCDSLQIEKEIGSAVDDNVECTMSEYMKAKIVEVDQWHG